MEMKKKLSKTLACWIYWEDVTYYCPDCIEIRLKEINNNKEFAYNAETGEGHIHYENGEECGYHQDYADEDCNVYCEKCGRPLFSKVDC